MSTKRGAHLVELARVFAGTPIASEWAGRAAKTRRARKAQLRLPGLAGGAEVAQQRAELRSGLLEVLHSLGAKRREVSVDEIAALGLPLLVELQEMLGVLPGGANPAVLAKVAAAKLQLTAEPSAVHSPRRGGTYGA